MIPFQEIADASKRAIGRAGEAADARIAERAADTGVTLGSGVDPMPAVDAAISKHHASTTKTNFSAAISNAAGGEIKLTLTDTQTAALAAGRQVYDILLTAPDGTKERVVEGMALVRDGVT